MEEVLSPALLFFLPAREAGSLQSIGHVYVIHRHLSSE